MPLMVSNFNLAAGYNRFTVIYDGGNAKVNGFNGELDFKESDDFNIFGRVEFKDYQMATEAQAWNLPKFKLTAGTSIQISDNVKITGSLLIRGTAYDKSYILSPTPGSLASPFVVPVPISSFVDLSGGVEYKVNSKIFIFGKVNNILNTANQ